MQLDEGLGFGQRGIFWDVHHKMTKIDPKTCVNADFCYDSFIDCNYSARIAE
jgi:hypothetical protein